MRGVDVINCKSKSVFSKEYEERTYRSVSGRKSVEGNGGGYKIRKDDGKGDEG